MRSTRLTTCPGVGRPRSARAGVSSPSRWRAVERCRVRQRPRPLPVACVDLAGGGCRGLRRRKRSSAAPARRERARRRRGTGRARALEPEGRPGRRRLRARRPDHVAGVRHRYRDVEGLARGTGAIARTGAAGGDDGCRGRARRRALADRDRGRRLARAGGVVTHEALTRDGLAGVRVDVVDITLRDGMQAANVGLTTKERIEVALRLDDAGVDVIQVGFAGHDEELARTIKDRVGRARINLLLLGFHPDAEEHLRSAAGAGIDVLEILVRSGHRQLSAMGLTEEYAISLSGRLCRGAAESFPEVWFCPSFSPVAKPEVLTEMLETVAAAGVTHFNIPDSSGVAAPG